MVLAAVLEEQLKERKVIQDMHATISRETILVTIAAMAMLHVIKISHALTLVMLATIAVMDVTVATGSMVTIVLGTILAMGTTHVHTQKVSNIHSGIVCGSTFSPQQNIHITSQHDLQLSQCRF